MNNRKILAGSLALAILLLLFKYIPYLNVYSISTPEERRLIFIYRLCIIAIAIGTLAWSATFAYLNFKGRFLFAAIPIGIAIYYYLPSTLKWFMIFTIAVFLLISILVWNYLPQQFVLLQVILTAIQLFMNELFGSATSLEAFYNYLPKAILLYGVTILGGISFYILLVKLSNYLQKIWKNTLISMSKNI